MTPDYIFAAPIEALDALDRYRDLLPHEPDIDWKVYPDIYAFLEHKMDLGRLEIELDKIEKEDPTR